MNIYSIVNVENLKLYEPSMLDQESGMEVLPTMEYLAPKYQVDLVDGTDLQKKSKETR
jgi:hypothetical protein